MGGGGGGCQTAARVSLINRWLIGGTDSTMAAIAWDQMGQIKCSGPHYLTSLERCWLPSVISISSAKHSVVISSD